MVYRRKTPYVMLNSLSVGFLFCFHAFLIVRIRATGSQYNRTAFSVTKNKFVWSID